HVVSLGASPSKVHVFPNGVNPDQFYPAPRDPAWRKRLGLGDSPVLGFVGGLRPWHGIEVLPEVLERLSARHRGIRLVIVGDGPLRPELERGLQERGLNGQAILTGALPHEDVPAVIRQFDVALAPYPALDHPFYFSPLKLFEYMACGIPVVAPDCGQIADILSNGKTGLRHPPGDLGALTDACDQLLQDSDQRAALGQSAARLVRSNYTWERNACRVVELGRQLVATRAPRRPAGSGL